MSTATNRLLLGPQVRATWYSSHVSPSRVHSWMPLGAPWVYPVGGGLWIVAMHPEMRVSTPYREWTFSGGMTRMPEFCAPALGNRANRVVIELDVPENANRVLYALGSAAGGLTLYMADGYVCYEYNLFILQRTKIRSEQRLPTGRVSLVIETGYEEARPAGPISVTATIDGAEVMSGTVPVTAPLAFTANDCLDTGSCLGSPVSLDSYDRALFPFEGTIDTVTVTYLS